MSGTQEPKVDLADILFTCKALELSAAGIYEALAKQSPDPEAAAFWLDIASDERRHVTYWEDLAEMETAGELAGTLEHPGQVLAELQEMQRNVQALLVKVSQITDISTAVFLACRLEFLMLNPLFALLFRRLNQQKGEHAPEEDYTEHIAKFQRFFNSRDAGVPGLQLIGEMLVSKWKQCMQVADQFEQIRTLRGLLPMCAGCKKIRDDDGFWKQVESYLQQELDVRFSHSLCPDCLERLYPDYTPRSRKSPDAG